MTSDPPSEPIAVSPPQTLQRPSRGTRTDASTNTVHAIVALTWPVVLGQLMVNAVPIVDILMLGRLGTKALAAVGYASQFLMLAQATLIAIGAACVAMMARAIGARQIRRARAAFAANLWLALGVTCLLSAIAQLYPHELLGALDVDESVARLALPYFRLTLLAAPLMGVAYTYEHAFRSARDTRVPMVIAGFSSLVKIGCNYLLLFGTFGFPKLGLIGAGIATLVSQALAAVLFVMASRRHDHPAVKLDAATLRITRETLREATAVAWPAVAERFVMTAAMLMYFRFLGGYGVAAVAAYNVGVRILAFTWIPGLGLSVAAGTLVGHALGAGDPALARRAGLLAQRIGVALAVALAAIFISLRIPIARCFTDDPEVIAALGPFILLLGVGLPFLVTHFTLAGALRGAGDTLTPLWAATFGNWVFRVPLGYVSARVFGLDLFWVWSIMVLDHLSRATWLMWSFHRGSWQQKVGTALRSRATGMPRAA